ncbi:MAG: UvrD-helicase domain-containing protein [Synergistaceae bacterium]|nr:UvrD-helicase domain-containing protein [Synergistaceae bacterium]
MTNFLPQDTPKGQRDAVTADDKTITVEAGAGTGKTWVLSQRYLRLLLDDDDLLPSDILTLTFTDAAAGEMKARIEQLIAESLHLFPNEERRQKILDGLSDSWISTIHAFSTRLIRESGLSLDIDPMASVISAYQEQSFWEDIRKAAEFATLGRLAQNYTGGEILTAAKSLDHDEYMNAAAGKWGAGTLAAFARKVADLHASSGLSWQDMMKWADDDSCLIADAGNKVMALLSPIWSRAWDLWKNIRVADVRRTDKAGNALNDFLDGMRINPPADDDSLRKFYDGIANNPDFIGRSDALVSLRESPVENTLSDWRKKEPATARNIAAGFESPLTKEEASMRRTLMKFCAVSWGIWDKMKSKRGLLSFSDMILHAKRTVESRGIRRAFRHILVDEFQDTDRLQFGMIEALRKYDDNSGLFAVGDPKQSIYKFRHAEPKLFADIMRHNDTRKIHLDTSFRTREILLSRINAMFSHLWPDGISRQEAMKDVKYNALSPANNADGRESGTMPPFSVYLLRNDDGAENSRRILASQLAGKISSWVNDLHLTIWDKKQGETRPVKYSDFAILARGRGCFSVLEEALERWGIPSVQDRSNDYFSRGEIGDIVCTLRAAADFSDDFSVMGWLMSPFSGVKEDDAITKCLMPARNPRPEDKSKPADRSHTPIELMRRNLPEAYSRLEYLSVVGENEGASGIIAFYDRKRDWLSCYPEKDRLRVLRNVRLALRIAREFQSTASSSLVSCAEYMTRSVRNSSQYEEPAWHDDGENAVRLGTVHSAKGLEYPVTVVFADRTKKNADRDALKPSRDLGLVFSKLPDEKLPDKFRPKLSEWHKLLSEQGDTEEEERLFYVACTRAQDSLIFCGLIKPIDTKTGDTTARGYPDTWSDFMLRSLDGVKPEILSAGGENTATSSGHDENTRKLTQVQTVKAERSLRQISATSFALYEWCPYAWRRKYRQGRTLTWELPDRGNDSDDDVHGGAALGSLAHWILSRRPKSDDYESDLDSLLYDRDTLGMLPGWLRDTWRHCDKETLRKWLMTFAASDLGVTLRNEPEVEREYRFRLPLNDDTVMAGSVDAVYGNNVVDYKITAIDDVPEGLYDSQLDFYAYIIHDKTKAESVNAVTVFLRENKTASRVVADFASIRERIERTARECASGKSESYPANHNHCGKCPFKKGCVKNAGTVQE